MADESAPRQTLRFRRLDPISPNTPPSRRNSQRRTTGQRDHDDGSVTEGDTGRDSVDHQQRNGSPADAAANTMHPATPQPDPKRRKVKRKRFLSLGRDGLNNYKRKQTAEEKEILEALDADTDYEGDVPLYDCIKVAGARLRPPTGIPEPADAEKGKNKITMGVRKVAPAAARRKSSVKATPVGEKKETGKKTVQTKLFATAKRSTEDPEGSDSLRSELSEHPDLDIGETELLSRTRAQVDIVKANDAPKEKTPATEDAGEAGPEPAKSDEPVHDDQIAAPPSTDRMEVDVPEPEEVHQPSIEASSAADEQLRVEQAQTGGVEKEIPETPMVNEDHAMSGTAPSAKPTNEEPVISAPRELTPELAPPSPKDERQTKIEQLVFVIFKFPNTTSQYQITGADIIDTTTKELSWIKLQALLEEKWSLNFSHQGLLINWEYRIKGQEQLNKCTKELLEHGRPGHEMVLLDFVRGKHLEDEAREVLEQLQRIKPDHRKGLATVPANLPDAKNIKRSPRPPLDSSAKRRTPAVVPCVEKETDANPMVAQDTAPGTIVLKTEEEVETPRVAERPRAVSSHSHGDSPPVAKRQAVDPNRRTSLLVSNSNVWSSGSPTSDRWNRRSTPTTLASSTSRWKKELPTGQTTGVRRASPLLTRAGQVKSSPVPVGKLATKTIPGPSGEIDDPARASKQQSKLPFRPADPKDSPKENPVVTDKVDVPGIARNLAPAQADDVAKKVPSPRPVGTPVKSTKPRMNGSPLDGLKAARGAIAASPLRPSTVSAFRAVTRPDTINSVEETSVPGKAKDNKSDTAIQPLPAPSPMQIDASPLAVEKWPAPKPSPKPASEKSNRKRPRTDDSAVPEESVTKIVDYKGPTDYKVVYTPLPAMRGLGSGLPTTTKVSSPLAKVATPEASISEAQSASSPDSTEEESEREKEEIAEQADRLLALAGGLFDEAPAEKAAAPKKRAARKRAIKSKEAPARTRSLIVKLPLPKKSSSLKTVEPALPATPATSATPATATTSVNSSTSQATKAPPSTSIRIPSFTPVNVANPRPIITKPLPPPQTLPAKPQPYRRPDRLDTAITPAHGFRPVNARPSSGSAATTTPRPNVSLPRPPAFGIPRPPPSNSAPGSNKPGTISAAAVNTPTAFKPSASTPATTKASITPLVPRDNFLYWDGQTSPPATTTPPAANGWALPTLERTITAAPLTSTPSTAAFAPATPATPASPPLLPPSSIRFSISRLHAPHTKILVSGHEIAKFSNPAVLDWEKLAEIVRGNLGYNDYHESMIVNMQFLVEDQETLERWRARYGTTNEVLVCEVDDLGRPTDRGLVEKMKRRRREERERLEEV